MYLLTWGSCPHKTLGPQIANLQITKRLGPQIVNPQNATFAEGPQI